MNDEDEPVMCSACLHRDHPNDVCEEDLGEFGECSCADYRGHKPLKIGGSFCMPIYALDLSA